MRRRSGASPMASASGVRIGLNRTPCFLFANHHLRDIVARALGALAGGLSAISSPGSATTRSRVNSQRPDSDPCP